MTKALIQFRKAITLLALCIDAGAASATTITFDGPPETLYASHEESGFIVSGSQAFWITRGGSLCYPSCVYNGTTFVITQTTGIIYLASRSGSPFDLQSFDFGELVVDTDGFPELRPEVTVIGHLASGGVVNALFIADGINDGEGPLSDFELALLPTTFKNLISVDFVAYDEATEWALDNVVAQAVVPLPPTIWLLGTALGLIGWKRQQTPI